MVSSLKLQVWSDDGITQQHISQNNTQLLSNTVCEKHLQNSTLQVATGGSYLEDVLLEHDVLDEGLRLDVGLGQHGGRGGLPLLGVTGYRTWKIV